MANDEAIKIVLEVAKRHCTSEPSKLAPESMWLQDVASSLRLQLTLLVMQMEEEYGVDSALQPMGSAPQRAQESRPVSGVGQDDAGAHRTP